MARPFPAFSRSVDGVVNRYPFILYKGLPKVKRAQSQTRGYASNGKILARLKRLRAKAMRL